jgi:hypothetical protein
LLTTMIEISLILNISKHNWPYFFYKKCK